jgi:hypothetical protein
MSDAWPYLDDEELPPGYYWTAAALLTAIAIVATATTWRTIRRCLR